MPHASSAALHGLGGPLQPARGRHALTKAVHGDLLPPGARPGPRHRPGGGQREAAGRVRQ